MIRYLIIIVLAALSLTAMAQQKKVAVYVAGEQNDISQALANQLVEAFAKSGKYIAIERTGSFLAELSKEQNYQRTGAVDDNELSRLGKQFGVQWVCVAKIGDVFGQKNISARLIDVESAEVTNSSNAYSKLESLEEFMTVVDKITKELTSKTVQERTAEALAKQKAQEETERMLVEGFKMGYIKCGDLYATISYSRVKSYDARDAAEAWEMGGNKDWRVPNMAELNIVKQACRYYCVNKEYYSKLSIEQLEQLRKIYEEDSFWIRYDDDPKIYTCKCYVDKNGYKIKDRDFPLIGLMLVRDAK